VSGSVRVLPLTERLDVVAELTQALDLATQPGQQHLMDKVVGILRGEILEIDVPLGPADLECLLDAMSGLEHEAGRIVPVTNVFNRQAHVVIDALLRTSDRAALATP